MCFSWQREQILSWPIFPRTMRAKSAVVLCVEPVIGLNTLARLNVAECWRSSNTLVGGGWREVLMNSTR